ncbi:MAG: ATP-dependent zinc metalloprotease FtsH [Lachnospirales bacterium]
MGKHFRTVFIYLLIFAGILLAVYLSNNGRIDSQSHSNIYSYSDLVHDLTNKVEGIDDVTIMTSTNVDNSATVTFTHTDDTTTSNHSIYVPDLETFLPLLQDYSDTFDIQYNTLEPTQQIDYRSFLLPTIIFIFVIFMLMLIMRRANGGDGGAASSMNFGKSRAKMIVDDSASVTFDSVAGLDEEKKELEEVVEFLSNPTSFTNIGARVPKGFLLVGPPGTGKTLLAKAVAGEAGVPFFSLSGSDFVEMFVGVGASRVRDLFAQAKKNKPCLIFIDEIDAVARKRGAGLGGSHDEREQTLNQLLVEMDGFATDEGIIILAATNRVDILDPAILRPGRFDRRVTINPPDLKGRLEMLYLHSNNKKTSEDIDYKTVAQQTVGFTGADIENLLNEAAILAVRKNQESFDMNCIREAYIKVSVGMEKKERLISDKEKRITAYHEVGHAILHEMLPELDSVQIVSIIPTGSAGGYTMYAPSNDMSYTSKTKMIQDIISLLGGRVAEDIFFSDITTGASNDIMRATKIARAMVTRFGMSNLGPIQYGEDEHDVFLGRDISSRNTLSESISSQIDAEVKSIIDDALATAYEVINKYKDYCHDAAELLLKNDKIIGKEFRAVFPEGTFPAKEDILDLSDQIDEYDAVAKEKAKRAKENQEKKRLAKEKIRKEREEAFYNNIIKSKNQNSKNKDNMTYEDFIKNRDEKMKNLENLKKADSEKKVELNNTEKSKNDVNKDDKSDDNIVDSKDDNTDDNGTDK